MEKKRITVPLSDAGERLDAYLAASLPEISRSFVQKLIENGYVSVNTGKEKASYKIKEGDEIKIEIPAPEPTSLQPADIPLDIIHEDEDIIVINKPAGLVVHPAHGHRADTLVNALLFHRPHLSSIGGVERPGIVHRLDKDTSGVIIVAKNDFAHNNLSEQFQARTVFKEYLCFVKGTPEPAAGTIDAAISRAPHNRKKFAVDEESGKEAVSHYEVVESFPLLSFVRVEIKTGRTHQIRVHMSSIGCPVIGDRDYGRTWRPKRASKELKEFLDNLDRVLLHAYRIEINHPGTGKRTNYEAELPAEFQEMSVILKFNTDQLP